MTFNLKHRFSSTWSVLAIPVVLLFILPAYLFDVPGGKGGDASFVQALTYLFSRLKDFQYGTDIAFTYGPLSFLRLRAANSLTMVYSILLFDIFMAANLLYYISRFLPIRNYFHFVILITTLYLMGRDYSEVLYLVILFFNCFQFLKKPQNIYLFNILIICSLSIFIKLNFALAQSNLVFVFFMYLLFTHKISLRTTSFFLLLNVSAVLILSWIFNVQIEQYLINSFHVIAGYNEAMVLPIGWGEKKLLAAVLVLFSLAALLLLRLFLDYRNFDSAVRIIFISAGAFLLFKYGFVRSDHYEIFYRNILLFIALLVLYEQGTTQKWSRYLFVSVFGACCVFLLSSPIFNKQDFKKLFSVSYLTHLANPQARLNYKSNLADGQLMPLSIRKKIGNSTVDVIDRELSVAFLNRLNYTPRPSLQSYCAYNYFLDTMNSIHFTSMKAPAFVLFTNSTIDDRCAIWDESITKRTLLLNYSVIDSFRVLDYRDVSVLYLVMGKNERRKQFIVEDIKETSLKFNQKYYPDSSSSLQFLTADIQYSLFGKIKSALFQPDRVVMYIYYEDEDTWHWHAIPTILKTGVLINKMVYADAAYKYFTTSGKDNVKVKWFYFTSESEKSFESDIKCNFKTMSVSD